MPAPPAGPVPASGGAASADGVPSPAAIGRPWAAASERATAWLIAMNLVPLVGVLGFGWSVFDLMLLYWFENGVVGLFTWLKILRARGAMGGLRGPLAVVGKAAAALFFAAHYGSFWAAQGALVFLLFGDPDRPLAGPARGDLPHPGTALAALGLIVSHTASFVDHALRRGEDLEASPLALTFRPYGRVLVVHAALVVGALAALVFGQPLAALVALVVLKIGVDLWAHRRSHRARPVVG